MEINNRPFPPLTSGSNSSHLTLPTPGTVLKPQPLTDEQKNALERLRDALKNQSPTPPTVTTPKTTLIDEVV